MLSYGNDDLPLKPSFVKINGEQVNVRNRRGFTLVRINNDCSVNETSQYDTYRRETTSETDRIRDYLQNLPKNTRIAGTTYDEFTNGLLDDAKDALTDVGIDLSTASFRSSLCFVFTTGKPQQTKQSQAARYNGPSMLSTSL